MQVDKLMEKRVIDMTGEELDCVMFHSSRGANKQLYGGLNNFFVKENDDLELIIKELDEIKTLLKMLVGK